MINDLTTPCPTLKYVDDMTVFAAVSNNPQECHTQSAAITWSHKISMNINLSKTKAMLIFLSRVGTDVPHILVGGV